MLASKDISEDISSLFELIKEIEQRNRSSELKTELWENFLGTNNSAMKKRGLPIFSIKSHSFFVPFEIKDPYDSLYGEFWKNVFVTNDCNDF